MARRTRPSVTLRCPADAYHGPGERIIEFSYVDDDGKLHGGLIAFTGGQDRLVVDVYLCDPGVILRPDPSTQVG